MYTGIRQKSAVQCSGVGIESMSIDCVDILLEVRVMLQIVLWMRKSLLTVSVCLATGGSVRWGENKHPRYRHGVNYLPPPHSGMMPFVATQHTQISSKFKYHIIIEKPI